MFKKLIGFLLLTSIVLFVFTPLCYSQGFSNDNQGTKALGQANAFIARASDPSAIWYNPAGITQLKGIHIYLGGSGFAHNPEVRSQEFLTTFTSENSLLISPHLYLSYQLSKNLWAGLGFSTPSNYLQNWGDDPVGNQAVRSSETFRIYSHVISPCLAVKINNNISLGLGLHYLRSNIKMTLWDRQEIENLAKEELGVTITDYFLRSDYDLSCDTLTFFGGIQARISDALIFGFSYQGGRDMESKGTLDFDHKETQYPALDPLVREAFPDVDVTNLGTTTVHQFTFGLAFLLSRKLELEVNYNYKLWSHLEKWEYVFSKPIIEEDLAYYTEGELPWYWQNSHSLRFGAEFHANESFDLRTGISLNQSPVPAERLILVVPDSNNTAIHLGLGYKINKFKIDIAYTYKIFAERANDIPNWNEYGITVLKTYGSVFGISLGFTL